MKGLLAATAAGLLAVTLAACYGPPSTDCSPNECRVSFSKQYQIDAWLASGDGGFTHVAVDYLCNGDGAWRRTGRKDILTAQTLSDGDTIRTQVYCPTGIDDAHGVDHAW